MNEINQRQVNKYKWAHVILLLTFTLALSFIPGYNADLRFYVMGILEYENIPADQLILRTHHILRSELPADKYAEFAGRLDASGTMMMDFFRIKPLYTLVAYFFHSLGFSYTVSTLLPSWLSYFFLGRLTFSWLKRIIAILPAFVISLLLMLIDPMIVIARLSSPDGLSALCLFAVFYCIYFEHRTIGIYLLLIASIGVRVDNLVTVLLILVWLKFGFKSNHKSSLSTGQFAVAALVSIVAAFLILRYCPRDHYWYERISYIDSSRNYFKQSLIYFQSISRSFLSFLLLLFVISVFQRGVRYTSRQVTILLLLGAILVTRFFLFPSFEERFFSAFYLAAFLVIIEHMFGSSATRTTSARLE